MRRKTYNPVRAATIAIACLAAWPARPMPPCPIPPELSLSGLTLPAAKAAAATRRLTIVTLGGAYTAGTAAGDPGLSYPARLEAELTDLLPGIEIQVVNEAAPGNTAADVPPTVGALLQKTGARLVIWGPGARDAKRTLDPGDFFGAVQAGIDAVRRSGADLILLDVPLVPSMERIARFEAYRDMLHGAATSSGVPFLARYDLMRHWSETGTLNLAASGPTERQTVARALYACVAGSLAGPIAAAVR